MNPISNNRWPLLALALATCSTLFLVSKVEADFTPPPITVPEGFELEIAAAPPLVKHPMMACLDERGRMFIAETRGLNLAKEELLKQRGRFIRMLEDTDNDGKFDKGTIFVDGLVMPEGALWHRGALYVLSSPYLWRFEDTDDDGVADRREKLVGYMEFNGKANQHGAYIGPNGRIYFSGGHFGYDLKGTDGKSAGKGKAAGVFSCRDDGSDVEIFGNGGVNPVEVAFTPGGEMLSTCAIFSSIGGRRDALIHWVRGGVAGPRDYHPPVLKTTGVRLSSASLWGQTAPSGLVRYRSNAFGAAYKDTFFAAHFNTKTVTNTRLERHGSTLKGIDRDFLTSTSIDFHPTDVMEDADGSLLVMDTGGWFHISCPTSRVAKPEILGAIYRVKKTGVPRPEDPSGTSLAWDDATSAQLASRLDDPRPVVRDRAREVLVSRGETAVPALQEALTSDSTQRRRNGVWALSRITGENAMQLVRAALSDTDATVRQAAVRSVGVLKDRDSVETLIQLTSASPPFAIARASATALGQIGDVRAVPALLKATAVESLDSHHQHALIYALIEIGDYEATLEGLASGDLRTQRAALIAVDRINAERLGFERIAPYLDSADAELKRTALEILTSRKELGHEIAGFLEKWLGNDRPDQAQNTMVRTAIATFSEDPEVQNAIRNVLASAKTTPARISLVLEAIGLLTNLPEPWAAPLGELLRVGGRDIQRKILLAASSARTNHLNDPLLALALASDTPADLRVLAWRCLALGGGIVPADGFNLLKAELSNRALAPLDRLVTAEAIASANLTVTQLAQVAEAVEQIGPLELPVLIDAFDELKEGSGDLGRKLVAALEKSPGLTNITTSQLTAILENFPPEVRELGQSLLKKLDVKEPEMESRIVEMLGKLSAGDVRHGKAVFYGNKAICSACHRVGNEGGEIGPDLSQIGHVRTRKDFLEAILYPSASIVNDYQSYVVNTKTGDSHMGVLERVTATAVTLRNATRQETVVPRSAISKLTPVPISIMPQGLESILSIEELSDLLAYIESLKPRK
jgi:putative membrane-bound dehydrogenase-like protein